jgi:hypothetical protein
VLGQGPTISRERLRAWGVAGATKSSFDRMSPARRSAEVDEMICDMAELTRELMLDQGCSSRRFRSPTGMWMIGIGHNLQGKQFSGAIWSAIKAEHPHIENGMLDDYMSLSDTLVKMIFRSDVVDTMATLYRIWPQWDELGEMRKRGLINWSFQSDYTTLARCRGFWQAVKLAMFDQAAQQLQESLWFRESKASRSSRVIRQISDGP